ncbi:MFS transporter [Micromonospora sp. NPDC018662]|uniref:MFS transporter n=1 Tax=Micromonospora sp. NPDC018662 TaxID=3364238 RepID=UPI00379C84A1
MRLTRHAARALLSNGPLARFLATKTVSSLANGVGAVALPVYLLADSGPLAMGLFLSISTLATLAMLPVAGILADRLPRGRLIRLGYAVSAASPVALLVLDGVPRVEILGAALAGAGGALGSPATRAGLADLVGPGQLAAAQGLVSSTQNIVSILTPALAGVFLTTSPPAVLLVAQTVTFGFALLLTPHIGRAVDQPRAEGPTDAERSATRLIRRTPWIRTGLIQTSVQILLGFAPGLVLIRLVSTDRYGSAGLGAILAVSAGAALVGTVVAAVQMPRLPGLWANLGFVCYTPVFLCLVVDVPLWTFVAAIAVGGVGISLHGVWWYAAINEGVAVGLRGRVNATDLMTTKLLEPVGMALAIPASSQLGLRTVCLIGATTFLVAPVLALLTRGFPQYGQHLAPVPSPMERNAA